MDFIRCVVLSVMIGVLVLMLMMFDYCMSSFGVMRRGLRDFMFITAEASDYYEFRSLFEVIT